MAAKQLPNTEPYPPEIMELNNDEGFIRFYWSMLHDYSKNEDAYEATERNHLRYFQKRKYKNYESFRVKLSTLKKQKNPPFGMVEKNVVSRFNG